ncbi:universal stress protein [Streptomyces sp. 7R007]
MKQVIVVGVDRSSGSRPAADWAAREALLRDLPLRVAHVAAACGARQPFRPETVVAGLAARYPRAAMKSLRLTGEPAAVLLRRGAETDVAMTVLGLRGEGGRTGLFPGTTARAVAGGAGCPVVLVPGARALRVPADRPARIAVAVDARAPADGALDFAFDTARLRGVHLTALHAGPPPVAPPGPAGHASSAALYAARAEREIGLLTEVLRPWRAKYPSVRVLEDVVLFDPAQALVRTSGRIDLLVVGRGAGAGLGPVAYTVARFTGCPLAVVPA